MKHIRAIIFLLIIVVLLGGCSFSLGTSADKLIDPISISGTNAEILNALDSYCEGEYTLKTPLSGEYTNSFIFFDLDLDSEDEVIAFYQPSSDKGKTNIAVIDKKNGKWSVSCNIKGEGKNLYSIDFCQLLGDDHAEIIVLWNTGTASSNHLLTAYSQKYNGDSLALKKIGKSMTVNDYITVDIDNTGVSELLAFTLSGGESPSAKATLYTIENNSFTARSSTKLDGNITGYKSIVSENTDQGFCVFADAVKSNKKQLLTELIIWSDYYGEIVSPYYSYSTGKTAKTARKSKLCSMDVNGDGYIEIPIDAGGITLPKQVEAVDWKQYRNTVLKHVCYTVAVQKDNYQLLIPDDLFKKISVSYNEETSKLSITDKNKKVAFSVMHLAESEYKRDLAAYSNLIELTSDSGYIYLAELGKDSDIKITAQDLKTMIKSYEGE